MTNLLVRLLGRTVDPVTAEAAHPARPAADRVEPIARRLRWGAPLHTVAMTPEALGSLLQELVDDERTATVAAERGVALTHPVSRAVVVDALVAHEQLADDSCRCGHGRFPAATSVRVVPGSPLSPMWHAEHVGEQVLATLRGLHHPTGPAL
jgi:hypothetical protein